MVKAVKGVLITAEPSVKEVILKLNEAENFLVKDINDEAVFITSTAAPGIKERINRIMSSGNFQHLSS